MVSKKEVQENLLLTAPTIYEIVRKEGQEEIGRPISSLIFSGIAAGLGISFSLFVMGYLSLMTENPLIIASGYCVGFLIVIKGRLQLFTENTITVILPLLKEPSKENFKSVGRLWAIVFIANMVGTGFAAFLMGPMGIATEDQLQKFLSIARQSAEKDNTAIFLTAIPAGFILAATVWMLPNAGSSKTSIILIMTYIISIGHFSHVVAGSTKIFLLFFESKISLLHGLSYIGLAGLGNIIGGSVLFSVLAYAQTFKELN